MPHKAILTVSAFMAAIALAGCHGQTKAHAQEASTGASAAFMAKTAKQPGVITLPSGLEYKIVRSGPKSGPSAKEGDEVKVNYEGTLTDGTVFRQLLSYRRAGGLSRWRPDPRLERSPDADEGRAMSGSSTFHRSWGMARKARAPFRPTA